MTNETGNVATPTSKESEQRESLLRDSAQKYLNMIRTNPRGIKLVRNDKGYPKSEICLFLVHYPVLKAAGKHRYAVACATRACMVISIVTQLNIGCFKDLANMHLAAGRPERALTIVGMAQKKGAMNLSNCAGTVYKLLMIRVDALDLMGHNEEADKAYEKANRHAEVYPVIIRRNRLTSEQRQNGTFPSAYLSTR